MHHEGALTEEVFFSLAITSQYLYKSVCVECLVDHAWNAVIKNRYHLVALHQGMTILALWLWALFMYLIIQCVFFFRLVLHFQLNLKVEKKF